MNSYEIWHNHFLFKCVINQNEVLLIRTYLFEVLREIRGNADQLLEIEESIKLAIQPYTPLIPFSGSATECTKEPIDLDGYLS